MSDGERRSGRRGRRRAETAGPARTVDYRRLVNPMTPVKGLPDEAVERIHDTALRVLEELGIRVLHDGARERFRAAGAAVDDAGRMVRLDRGMVEALLAAAPPSFEIQAGSPDRAVAFGGASVAFICVGGAPHISDLDRGKRPGTLADTRNIIRLGQHFDVIHLQSPNVESQDVETHLRHLHVTESMLTLSDKPPFVYSRGAPQVHDCFEMIRLARGLDEAGFRARPWCYTVINSNSPRQLDIPMCQGLIDFAEAGQVSVVTPFTLSGAMAPVTITGALVLQHAEAMAGIALTQIVNPGAPVIYGSFTSNVDMKSGSPAFGTPEYVKGCFVAGQLARRLGLPWRGSAATASKIADAQAVYETVHSAWGAMLGGVNLMAHAAGWLEGGLTGSLEKLVLDIEMLQTLAEVCHGLPADEADLAYEAIAEVEPGGHFFAAAHTMERYSTAFYPPLVSDWSNFGQWTENGGLDATRRANGIWKAILADFQPPALDPGVAEALNDFVARRTAEGGAPPES